MRMISLQNKNKKKYAIAAFFSLLILIVLNDSAGHIVSKSALAIARPFFQINNSIRNWLEENVSAVEEKKTEVESRLLACEIAEKQNEELKSLLSRVAGKQYLVASVLSRPPQSTYDILIIDVGSKDGVEKGMRVTAYGDILLGYVSEVFPKTSKIKLASFSKEETNVMLMSSGVSAIAIGRGGENFEIILPRSIEARSGELIATLGINPLLAGIVERVEIDPADPFQKILFRLPLNIQELKYVMLKIE